MNPRPFQLEKHQSHQRRHSLQPKVIVRTTRLPKDFFQTNRSITNTRSSSSSKSIETPQTPMFGKKDSPINEQLPIYRRRKRSQQLSFFGQKPSRYNQIFQKSREIKTYIELPFIGRKNISVNF